VRCGVKKQNDTTKRYVHMLNGTLCATERALCCIVENYQTPEVRAEIPVADPPDLEQGLTIPEVLRKYMGGRDFIPYVRELPKSKKK
jgi:seryl-tRNA synthetase